MTRLAGWAGHFVGRPKCTEHFAPFLFLLFHFLFLFLLLFLTERERELFGQLFHLGKIGEVSH